METVVDQRRVRFASIEGLACEDLPLAGEIWLDELFRAPWVSREIMKLGAHFVRYMANPSPGALMLKEIERNHQLLREDVGRALALMVTFNAVDAFTIEKDTVKVALNLTLLQRLRVLETKARLAGLQATSVALPAALPAAEPRWVPEAAAFPGSEDDASVAPLLAIIAEHIRRAADELVRAERPGSAAA